jgi:hypothetical protein
LGTVQPAETYLRLEELGRRENLLDFALAAAMSGVLMYLLMRTRRMKRRLAVSDEPRVERNLIVIKHSFDEELPASPEMITAVPCGVPE